jgi:hypothetical protein
MLRVSSLSPAKLLFVATIGIGAMEACGSDNGRATTTPGSSSGGQIGQMDAAGGATGTDAPTIEPVGGTGGEPAVAPGSGGDTNDRDGSSIDSQPGGDMAAPTGFPREIDARIVINEIMASNALTLKNEAGLATDWIELYNPTTEDIPLTGYAFTDDFNVPRKAPIGAGVVLTAGAHMIFWIDGMIDRGPNHIALPKLESIGSNLGFARPDGSFISRLTIGRQETDFSAAREPDGSDDWVIEWHPSPGAANPAGAGKPLGPADPATLPEKVLAAGDLSEALLGYDALPSIRIDVDADGQAKLTANPLVDVPATLVFQGRSYGPVGLRLKGHNSFEPWGKKPSMKISVDKYVPDAKFWGLNDLTFNNMHSDPSMMHERLAYWVARTAAVIPASRAAHTMVSINGQPPALYIGVETVKHTMMARWFKMATGSLYEGFNVDFTHSDTDYMPPRDDVPFFELKGKIEDRSLLAGLADATAIKVPDQAIAAARNVLNFPEYLNHWATCSVVGQFDSMPYSIPGDDFLVYSNPEDKKLNVLPWGMDETFEASDVDLIKRPYSVLARTCLASPTCLQQYADAAWALLDKVEAMKWSAERARIAQQIAPLTVMDHLKSYTDKDVVTGQQNMAFFIDDRRTWFTKFLPPRSK